jgi:Flp pilus assembly protein TadD
MRRFVPLLALSLASCGLHHGVQVDNIPPAAPALSQWKPSLHIADAALANGEPQIALQIADEMLTARPRDVEALVRRGQALGALGQTSEADITFQTALRIEPRNIDALIGLARLHMMDDPGQSERLLSQAAILAPHNSGALNNLGVARDMLGRHADAQKAYRLAMAADPTSSAAQENLGLSLALSGDAAQSLRLLAPLAADPSATPRYKQNYDLALALANQPPTAAAAPAAPVPAAPEAAAPAPIMPAQRPAPVAGGARPPPAPPPPPPPPPPAPPMPAAAPIVLRPAPAAAPVVLEPPPSDASSDAGASGAPAGANDRGAKDHDVVRIRTGQHAGYSRIVVDLPAGTNPQMTDQGATLVIHFIGGDGGGNAEPEMASRSSRLAGVSSIDTAPGQMTVSLMPGAHMTPESLPGRLVLDVRP